MTINDQNQKEPEKKPTPGEIFRSAIGWALAAVLVIAIPTAILCREWGKIALIVMFSVGFAAVVMTVACTGWQDKNK